MNLKLFYSLAILCIIYTPRVLFAQKLPNKQENSVWLLLDSKIDGKAMEWNNQFQAYNHATELFFTMANDERSLYLIIYTTDAPSIFNKILTGGLTLLVDNSKQQLSITYPFFAKKNRPYFKRIMKGDDDGLSDFLKKKLNDSLMLYNNAVLAAKAKEMLVHNNNRPDSIVSIYNEDHIKVVGLFDAKLGYTFELCVPFKYLGLTENSTEKFKYKISVNGEANRFDPGAPSIKSGTRPDGSPMPQAELQALNNVVIAGNMARYAAVDFSGEYILAKKPKY